MKAEKKTLHKKQIKCQPNKIKKETFDAERYIKAKEVVEKFPVTKDMFPRIGSQPTWVVCK